MALARRVKTCLYAPSLSRTRLSFPKIISGHRDDAARTERAYSNAVAIITRARRIAAVAVAETAGNRFRPQSQAKFALKSMMRNSPNSFRIDSPKRFQKTTTAWILTPLQMVEP
jgi:hypothetical protein